MQNLWYKDKLSSIVDTSLRYHTYTKFPQKYQKYWTEILDSLAWHFIIKIGFLQIAFILNSALAWRNMKDDFNMVLY